jgi:hypothetical protein
MDAAENRGHQLADGGEQRSLSTDIGVFEPPAIAAAVGFEEGGAQRRSGTPWLLCNDARWVGPSSAAVQPTCGVSPDVRRISAAAVDPLLSLSTNLQTR